MKGYRTTIFFLSNITRINFRHAFYLKTSCQLWGRVSVSKSLATDTMLRIHPQELAEWRCLLSGTQTQMLTHLAVPLFISLNSCYCCLTTIVRLLFVCYRKTWIHQSSSGSIELFRVVPTWATRSLSVEAGLQLLGTLP